MYRLSNNYLYSVLTISEPVMLAILDHVKN
jgi:hypothetical protein